eukprot:scaffold135980_cov24-Tisochrysis_lutea.AAC.1
MAGMLEAAQAQLCSTRGGLRAGPHPAFEDGYALHARPHILARMAHAHKRNHTCVRSWLYGKRPSGQGNLTAGVALQSHPQAEHTHNWVDVMDAQYGGVWAGEH